MSPACCSLWVAPSWGSGRGCDERQPLKTTSRPTSELCRHTGAGVVYSHYPAAEGGEPSFRDAGLPRAPREASPPLSVHGNGRRLRILSARWNAAAEESPVSRQGVVETGDSAVASFREWERAEIERSGIEATLKSHPPAATSRRVLARYANPPASTAYPWEYAFHRLGDATGLRILDLGCGDGECTTLVASHGGRVAALDISTDLLARARTRCELDGHGGRVAPVCASAHALPVGDNSVDVVFGMAVLHHLDLQTAAREVHRVLKPGGRGIFAEPVRNSKLIAAIRDRIPYRAPDISPFERPLTFAEIDAFASRFRRCRTREFDLPIVQVFRVLGLTGRWERLAYASSAALLERFSFLRRYASAVVFEVEK